MFIIVIVVNRKKKVLCSMNRVRKSIFVGLSCLFLIGCGKKEITSLSHLEFEVNSEVKIKSLVKVGKDVKLLNEDSFLDTSKLGQKEVSIRYKKKNKENEYKVKVQVVDTTSPSIEGAEEQEIMVGEEIKFLSDVTVKDNSGENIIPTIEGDYNINKAGEYQLLYVAVDMSGNRTEKEFVLKVNDMAIKKTGYYVYKEKETWYGFRFKKNNKVDYLINFCPGEGCGGYLLEGSYQMNGNQLQATFTYETYDIEGRTKLKTPVKWTLELKSDKQIIYDKKKYNYQKNF